MKLFSIFRKPDRTETAQVLIHLKTKLQQVKNGEYLIKPYDHASNLSELESRLEREIARLEAKIQ